MKEEHKKDNKNVEKKQKEKNYRERNHLNNLRTEAEKISYI